MTAQPRSMKSRITVRPREYHDSVRLMQVSAQVRRLEGVEEAMLMMATDNNKNLLATAGIDGKEIRGAARDDLVIGVIARNADDADTAMAEAVSLLRSRTPDVQARRHGSLDSAVAAMPNATLTLISIPGEYAVEETRKALRAGLNVMLFSDNVPLDDEIRLKQLAEECGLLLMGPDCGTAIIGGNGLGFANAVRSGTVGIVGASGTGIQEIAVQLHHHGLGISHALGTGGRDLSASVGGLTMLRGIDMLAADPDTDVIVLTSKPPDRDVAACIVKRASACGKPVVVNFLGGDTVAATGAGLVAAHTLTGAATKTVQLLRPNGRTAPESARSDDELRRQVDDIAGLLSPKQVYLRGLFTGGTLCYEAMHVLQDYIGPVYSNIAQQSGYHLGDCSRSREHTLLDMGDDLFTRGRPHPMIDPELRNRRLLQESEESDVAVVLLDLVLGYGSHTDPGASLAETVRDATTLAAQDGRHLVVIASVCGTEQDPQGLARQKRLLADEGVVLAASNAEASRLAGMIISSATGRTVGGTSR